MNGDYLTLGNLVILILLIAGLVLLLLGLWRNWRIDNIASWPKVNATVINSVAQPTSGFRKNADVNPQNIVVSNNNRKYTPSVLYRYNVAGREYQSTNFVYGGPGTYNAEDIKVVMSQMQPGASVPVFYNPNNPSQSYVYLGSKNYTSVGVGLILLILSLFLAYREHFAKNEKKLRGPKLRMDPDLTTPIVVTEDRQYFRKSNKFLNKFL